MAFKLRPRKRLVAAGAVAAIGLFAVAILLATPGVNGRVAIRVLNASGGPLPRVEVDTSEGPQTFRDIPAGESRSFAVSPATTSRVQFRWEDAGGVSTASFSARPSAGGESLRAIEMRYAPGHTQVVPRLGADLPTRARYAFTSLRAHIGL